MAKKASAIPEAPAKVTWSNVAVPSLQEIKRATVGTAYAYKEAPGVYHLRVKVGANRWIQFSDRTVAKTVAEWKSLGGAPPAGTGSFTSDLQVCAEAEQCSVGLQRLER